MHAELYYFLPQDFEHLSKRIRETQELVREIGAEMGRSCQEGAETYHDNFAYEDGERQQHMWSRHLRTLVAVARQARVVTPTEKRERVCIGCRVTLRDESGAERQVVVGSYMVFDGEDVISYSAPLARLIIGACVGEVREGKVGREQKAYEVIAIE